MRNKAIITVLSILGTINIIFSQKDYKCTDSIIYMITDIKDRKIRNFINNNNCDIIKILHTTDSIIKNNNNYYVHERINFLYQGFINSKIARNNIIRKKLLDSYIIMLEKKSKLSKFVIPKLLYSFKSNDFNAEYIQRIKQLYPIIRKNLLPDYYKLVGKLRLKSFSPQLKDYLNKNKDERIIITVTAVLIRLNDEETINFFLN